MSLGVGRESHPTLSDRLRSLASEGLLLVTEAIDRDTLLATVEVARPADVWITTWAIEGQRSGHEWRTCSVCDQARLTKLGDRGGCDMTPGCEGRMERITPWPRRSAKLKANLGGGRG